MDATATVIFIIAAFSLGAIVIMKRDSLPPGMRRGLALIAIALIAFAFFLIVYAFFTMGSA
ncbi:hypothetical protein [Paenibacillus arenilitoris]|uniref:Signal transduction histidine kinase n=1 Tax=Paenibacillus arenilitoris TaxID=2772299 RepID=A0A927CWS9_9BACL|nr:hypothetical protein [Paenibacillus arenilitoris]MBD2872965.1 hypothetical protein [Paenibacillus arenilitoris]